MSINRMIVYFIEHFTKHFINFVYCNKCQSFSTSRRIGVALMIICSSINTYPVSFFSAILFIFYLSCFPISLLVFLSYFTLLPFPLHVPALFAPTFTKIFSTRPTFTLSLMKSFLILSFLATSFVQFSILCSATSISISWAFVNCQFLPSRELRSSPQVCITYLLS